ncbi:MAG: malate dehydrogenase, partial [Planctomycetota bacterium]
EAILPDNKSVLSCCAYCDSEYGIGGYFVGVPAVLGSSGIEKVIELDLNDSERTLLEKSISHVKQLSVKVDELL